MRLMITTISLSRWKVASYHTENWFLGADFSYEYKYIYLRILGVEATLGWQ